MSPLAGRKERDNEGGAAGAATSLEVLLAAREQAQFLMNQELRCEGMISPGIGSGTLPSRLFWM